MADNGMRQRQRSNSYKIDAKLNTFLHPGGQVKYGRLIQVTRFLLVITYFCSSCAAIIITQIIGAPLYWINQNYYYAYMAMTKEAFGIIVTILTQVWAPTVIRVSGHSSVAGQIRKTADGRLELNFPDRLVLIANHQLYSDWIYLWWVAYKNQPNMHGHIYIILKESLKHIPIIGWGMRFYGFIFMSRKLTIDGPRLSHRLRKLKRMHSDPLSEEKFMDPMWLLLFPEGTNASIDGRIKSRAWAKKQGVKDMEHTLLPRSSGSFVCLNELKGTVDYVYDCTLAYEGVQRGDFGQDFYTLHSIYILGQTPTSVNMYWRRFAVSEIPLHDKEEFDVWLRMRWNEKDALMDHYINTGRFPIDPADNGDASNSDGSKSENNFIETEVKTTHLWEACYIFIPLFVFVCFISLLIEGWRARIFSGILPIFPSTTER
ncbi:putative acyltransferase [Golovinomyces cichoracearum]|uniref:Putative acyltransferase n=1 Tax=Golovinomyces cichoracearum TaxID=62708 RepID=A0A420IS55_9PEZI|nr:putative acyltransferase [Golovinomyces cichoracearum]